MYSTSAMRGALPIVHGSSHSTAAAMSFRTAFLAPEMGSVPRNSTPPSIVYAVDWGRPASPPSPPGSASAILTAIVWLELGVTMQNSSQTETATLAVGCFWCIEAVYAELLGVQRVISDYAGGHVPNPSYEQVCSLKVI